MSAERLPTPTDAPGLSPRLPVATYRLQLHAGFGFDAARRLAPYLDGLGITDLYASPYLMARPGSAHGYDIVDHGRLNPELGTEDDYRALADELRSRGMGHILDVVPNHMGIAQGANRWWNDVLENGPSSIYADFFDIEWEPVKRQLANRVLLPILGDQYGRVLESQEIVLELHDGAFHLRYHESVLPVAPQSATEILSHRLDALATTLGEAHPDLQEYQSIITALRNLPDRTERAPERVRERMREKDVVRRRLARLLEASEAVRGSLEETVRVFNGKPGDPRSFDLLERLLDAQAYRLAHWRVAADEINYRRFFDINDMVALRIERPAVFEATHQLVLRLVEEGTVTGLRIDHPDGLHDPAAYFLALQAARVAQHARSQLAAERGLSNDALEAEVARLAAAFQDACRADPRLPSCRPLYVVAEKILAPGESLPRGWAVHGTTGYDFLALVGGLFVDPAGTRPLTAAYGGFTGRHTPFPDVAYVSKRLIMDAAMASELGMLGHALSRMAERDRYARDFTLQSLTYALREVIACFPVYRTYVAGSELAAEDRAHLEAAIGQARRRNPATSAAVFDFVRDVLLLRYPEHADDAGRLEREAFVRKFQQVTAPVTAKGIEDTAFYRYNRLVSLNEVGGDPDRFGVTVDEFHRQCVTRQARGSAGFSATSTHDTKRSEDVRARISVLSELPGAWRAAVARWHRWNQRYLGVMDGQPAPDPNDEYLFYQTLVGAWPLDPVAPGILGDFVARIQAYMAKATREAKVHTSWVSPNAAYDAAVEAFAARTLEPEPRNRFLIDFAQFHEPVARLGMVNALAQTLLKITAPGVPDFYQGTELWDLHLVDPDNRRPVDFEARQSALAGLRTRIAAGNLSALARELVERWRDGQVKLYVTHRALATRRGYPALFREGAYVPLQTTGASAGHVCAFARQRGSEVAIVVVPRLIAPLTAGGARLPLGEAVWGDTAIRLSPDLGMAGGRDGFTGAAVEVRRVSGHPVLQVGALLADFPVALLTPGDGEAAA